LNQVLPGYRIGEQIGTGAGSRIFRATKLKTGKEYAVKWVTRNSAEDDRFVEQIRSEYKLSHRLEHDVLRRSFLLHPVRRGFQVRDWLLVMEYLDGLTLAVARPNRLNTFYKVFRRVAEGLGYMHEAGYVHADLKPINIMIVRGGGVKIIDFGQACPMGTAKQRVQGTPDFIAPEQVRKMPLDRRTDVFNLGATMYWVLTSQNFPTVLADPSGNGAESLNTKDRPLAPIELNDRIPKALSVLVMECCAANPTARPADMGAVAARLESLRQRWLNFREDMKAGRTGNQRSDRDPSIAGDLA
jgi:serine/threonine-protein kinase